MCFMIRQDCKCCVNPRIDFWHCWDCWNKYHNGLKDQDWQDLGEYIASGQAQRMIDLRKEMAEDMKKIMERSGMCKHLHVDYDENSWRCRDCGEGGID